MSAIMNKFSNDGYEIGASKIGVIVLGKNNFYVREYLRYQFRKIQLGEIEQMDSTSAPNAAKRGQYLEPGLREWVSDELDELCSHQEGQMSCNLYIPKEGFHKKEYKMAASLDGILEIKGGKLPFYDRLEDKMVNLEAGKKFSSLINNSSTHIIEGCGHMIMIEKAFEMRDNVLKFLKK